MESKTKQRLIFLIIIGLLVIRILIPNIGAFVRIGDLYLMSIFYELPTYAGLAFLIVLEREHLDKYNLDNLAILAFILFGSVLRIRYLSKYNLYFEPVLWLIAIGLLITIFPYIRKMKSLKLNWIIIGIGVGLIASFPISYLNSFQIDKSSLSVQSSQILSLHSIILELLNQFSNTVIFEEFLFRGFLWGYLRDIGWQEKKIFIFQAILFWFAHISRLVTAPISFLIVVPIGGFLLGILVWQSKSVTTSMFAHAILNTLGEIFEYLIVYNR